MLQKLNSLMDLTLGDLSLPEDRSHSRGSPWRFVLPELSDLLRSLGTKNDSRTLAQILSDPSLEPNIHLRTDRLSYAATLLLTGWDKPTLVEACRAHLKAQIASLSPRAEGLPQGTCSLPLGPCPVSVEVDVAPSQSVAGFASGLHEDSCALTHTAIKAHRLLIQTLSPQSGKFIGGNFSMSISSSGFEVWIALPPHTAGASRRTAPAKKIYNDLKVLVGKLDYDFTEAENKLDKPQGRSVEFIARTGICSTDASHARENWHYKFYGATASDARAFLNAFCALLEGADVTKIADPNRTSEARKYRDQSTLWRGLVRQKDVDPTIFNGIEDDLKQIEQITEPLSKRLGEATVLAYLIEHCTGVCRDGEEADAHNEELEELVVLESLLPRTILGNDPGTRFQLVHWLVTHTEELCHPDLGDALTARGSTYAQRLLEHGESFAALCELVRDSTLLNALRNLRADSKFEVLLPPELAQAQKEIVSHYQHGRAEALPVKHLVLQRGEGTKEVLRTRGVTHAPFFNLSNPQIVELAVKALASLGATRVSSILTPQFRELGLNWRQLKPLDIEAYSDEIALMLISLGGYEKELGNLREHCRQAFSIGDVSFRFAARSNEDKKLGKLCGDCTAEGGVNEDKVEIWKEDPCYQQMSLLYKAKFIGRMNLAIVESDGNPLLIIDAIEFVPQARERAATSRDAQAALVAGLERVKSIADSMGVKPIAAYSFSNSESVDEVLVDLGYEKTKRYRIQTYGDTTESFTNSPRKQFLQCVEEQAREHEQRGSVGEISPNQLSLFERSLNQALLLDPTWKANLKRLADAGEWKEAAAVVWNFDLMVDGGRIYKGLGFDNQQISLCLQRLYGQVLTGSSTRTAKLTVIRGGGPKK